MGSFKDLSKLRGLAEAGLVVRSAGDQEQARRAEEVRRRVEAEEARAAAVVAGAPHYPWARAGTLAEVRALLEEHAMAFSLADRGEVEVSIDTTSLVQPPQIADGDVAIEELRLPSEGTALYVRGDLTVSGRIVQRFRAGVLVVFGSLRARHLVTTGQILVLGDLEVTGTLYGNCTNYATVVLGATRVGTLISAKGHMSSFLGPVAIGELVEVEHAAPNVAIYARTTPRSTRTLDPALGDSGDGTGIANALADRDDLLVPARS
ncbi:MAG: hypothetical protein H0X17_18885 [Deltaproteobacteria bacterium]|nr:hypothetical protein [Deltaproteobacteria bacterium]